MPLSLSTCWRSSFIEEAEPLISAMKETGISTFELEFRIKKSAFDMIRDNREKWGIEISSLHAVCPSARDRGRGAEAHFLSDTDDVKRRQGLDDVLETIRNAKEIGARAIILHSGIVPMHEPIYARQIRFDEGRMDEPSARDELHSALLERMRLSKPALPQLLKSLDELNEAAVKAGILIGLENRYYFREMPNLDEFGVIFNTFDGGNLRYWHDTGHAHVQERMFGVSQKMLLDTFGDLLLGVHLHDVKGGYTDHNQPGCGEIDFEMVKRYLKPETIRVIEMNKRVTLKEAREGILFLKESGLA